MLDLVVENAMIADGSGSPLWKGCVGVEDGRITAVAPHIGEPARRRLDVEGRTVCPGFIDVHTHYDAQIMWDSAATPSCLHGVTTVFGGNCGFTIAPIDGVSPSYVLPMLARVEGMSEEALFSGLPLDWDSFGSWLDRLESRVAVNTGFLVGHSTMRSLVMGEAAVGGVATPTQVDALVALLHKSLEEGAYGFSSSWAESHTDHNGDPVPSRFASRDELLALAAATGSHRGTVLEFIPTALPLFDDGAQTMLADLAVTSGRPVNWNLLHVRPGQQERTNRASRLRASDLAAERGARVTALMLPQSEPMRLSMLTGLVYEMLPGWDRLFRLPPAERIRCFNDRDQRLMLQQSAKDFGPRLWTDWETCSVSDVGHPALDHLVSKTFGEIGAEQNKSAFDALIDTVIADDLETGIQTRPAGNDDDECWEVRQKLWNDPRVVIGGSDGGAHIQSVQSFAYTTRLLVEGVRNRSLIEMGEAIRLLTDIPARLYGLTDRGRLAPGYRADLVVFDTEQLEVEHLKMVADLPSGAKRLTAGSRGVHSVWVNGVRIVDDGQLTGSTPGHVLRHGG